MDENYSEYKETSNVGCLLKASEIAALLNISRSFAYQLLQSGAIPVVRLGKACRVRPKDLQAYVEQNLHRQVDHP
jgi:excisionase family DNA binding protein